MRTKWKERGQSLVELALILPILLLIVIAMVEVGYAMRNYLLVMSANREGVRFASRGRFTDDAIAQRVVTAGGVAQVAGEAVPFLRTVGDDTNTGIIITHLMVREDGTVTPTFYVSGTIAAGQPIASANSRVDLAAIATRNVSATIQINDMRQAAGYERLDSEIIILEVFYAHQTLWSYDIAIQGPYVMYTQSSMRVVSDSRERE